MSWAARLGVRPIWDRNRDHRRLRLHPVSAASRYDNSFSLPGTGSAMAQQLLARAVPTQAGDSDTIVWQVSTGTVRDRVIVARMTGVLNRIATMPEVAAVVSPYGPHGAGQISRDGRIAYATVNFTKQADSLASADITPVIDAAGAARAPGLNVQLGGDAIGNTEQSSLGLSSVVGLLAAAVVLCAQGGMPALPGPLGHGAACVQRKFPDGGIGVRLHPPGRNP